MTTYNYFTLSLCVEHQSVNIVPRACSIPHTAAGPARGDGGAGERERGYRGAPSAAPPPAPCQRSEQAAAIVTVMGGLLSQIALRCHLKELKKRSYQSGNSLFLHVMLMGGEGCGGEKAKMRLGACGYLRAGWT